MIGLSYKQKCNNFGYPLNEVQSKGNDTYQSLVEPFSLRVITFLKSDWRLVSGQRTISA